jgi:hypothetical protein
MVRRWLYWLLVGAFAWLIYTHWGELQQLQVTLAHGRWQWFASAIGLPLGFYLLLTWLYQVTLAVFQIESRFRQLFPLTFASVFVNLTAPTGGAAGPALFVQDAGRRALHRPVRRWVCSWQLRSSTARFVCSWTAGTRSMTVRLGTLAGYECGGSGHDRATRRRQSALYVLLTNKGQWAGEDFHVQVVTDSE